MQLALSPGPGFRGTPFVSVCKGCLVFLCSCQGPRSSCRSLSFGCSPLRTKSGLGVLDSVSRHHERFVKSVNVRSIGMKFPFHTGRNTIIRRYGFRPVPGTRSPISTLDSGFSLGSPFGSKLFARKPSVLCSHGGRDTKRGMGRPNQGMVGDGCRNQCNCGRGLGRLLVAGTRLRQTGVLAEGAAQVI